MKKIKKFKIPILLAILVIIIAAAIGTNIFTKDRDKTKNKTTSQALRPKVSPPAIVTFTKDGPKPAKVEIKKGKRIIWINRSGETISLNSDDHPTHSKYRLLNFGNIKDGSAAEHIFEKEGSYGYHNHLKPEQKGIVIVK